LDGSEKVSRVQVVFADEEQLLQAFIVVWSVGFVWCFVFLRRCRLSEATHVGIFWRQLGGTDPKAAPTRAAHSATTTTDGCWRAVHESVSLFFARAAECIQIFMSLLFSDRDCYHCQPHGMYQIYPVQREKSTAAGDHRPSRFLIVLFRRYNFNDETIVPVLIGQV
jgi:hypothetical protein